MAAQAAETELRTVRDVARQLAVSPQTIYRRVWDGELEAYRVGETGPLRIRSDAVDKLLRPAREHEA